MPDTWRRLGVLAATAALALPLAACGGGDGDTNGDTDAGTSASPTSSPTSTGDSSGSGTLNVLGAASLTEVFTGLVDGFEADHDGVDVETQFGSSTDLAEQAADGAPGDILATADEKSMQVAEDAGVTAEDPVPFATNQLVIVTAPGNPDHITGLSDLGNVLWVRCADTVPCGGVALTLLQDADVTAQPVSLEEDVKSTLEKVTSGEAEAGLVYATDGLAAGDDVTVVPIAGSEKALTTYYIAPLTQSTDESLAEEWVDLVTSSTGQDALTKAGFTLP